MSCEDGADLFGLGACAVAQRGRCHRVVCGGIQDVEAFALAGDVAVGVGQVDAPGLAFRLVGAVTTSKRPTLRPGHQPQVVVATAEVPQATSPILNSDITAALKEAQKTAPPVVAEAPAPTPEPAAEAETLLASVSVRPTLRPSAAASLVETAAVKQVTPKAPPAPEVITRVSTSGGRHWGVNVGRYPSRYAAEKVLLKTALSEISTLDGSLRKVVRRPQGFDANFLGMTRETADLACRRLVARNVNCFMIGPSS